MNDLIPAIVGLITAIIGTVSALVLARRYGKLGLGPEQLQLNAIRKETSEAYRQENERLEERLTACENGRVALKAQLDAEKEERRAERERFEERIVRLTVRLENLDRQITRPPGSHTRHDDA